MNDNTTTVLEDAAKEYKGELLKRFGYLLKDDNLDFTKNLSAQIDIYANLFHKSQTPVDAVEWISVEDKPLFTIDENGNWVCTEAGDEEFIAAVSYSDSKRPNEKNLWWIRHCVIEDKIGLCVVGDDDNSPAGWDMKDILFYQPLPKPPQQIKYNMKDNTNPHDCAFPNEAAKWLDDSETWQISGLTKREYFAAKAMQGMCAVIPKEMHDNEEIAIFAVNQADALMMQLNK